MLETNLKLERNRVARRETELSEFQKQRDRYELFFRIALGFIIFFVGIVIVFFSFPYSSWIRTHENRNGLYLASILLILGLAFLVADNNRKRKGLIVSGIILAVIIELIQVL